MCTSILFSPWTEWQWTSVILCKGTCLSSGLSERPCMDKAICLVQLPAPPSPELSRISSAETVVPLFAFYICTAAAAGQLARRWGQPDVPSAFAEQNWEPGLTASLVASVCLSLRLRTTGERWSVRIFFFFLCEMQFLQAGSPGIQSGGVQAVVLQDSM